jgi:tyrosyl-tRNA synthetase
MSTVIDALKERGFIEALTSEDIAPFTQQPVKVYCGFDPTADSLHLGNLIAMMGLAWFQRFGHVPVALVGGATGMIGDPSGKTTTRQLLDQQTIEWNLQGIKKNLETVLRYHSSVIQPIIVNNLDWYRDVSFIQFLRDIGCQFRLGPMLGKESVRQRLQSEEGMSFTEFSYQLLQAYDFLYLYQNYGVSIQMGGSDQWGNITAGIDLIRKMLGQPVYGLTFPLLTRSDGQKFGKSEKGAIWLSPDKLSAYEFYQYLVRMDDADVIKLMRLLTFMDMADIRRYEKQMQEPGYVPRTAQKRLAEEVTRLIHGEEGLKTAIRVTEGIAPGSQAKLEVEMLESLAADMPSCQLSLEQVQGKKLIDLLVEIGLQTSKSKARRLIQSGGVSINNVKVEDENCVVESKFLIDKRLMLIAVGKKNKILVHVHPH